MVRMATDMDHPQFQELLFLKGIRGHLFRVCAKAASTQELAYTLQADALLAQSKPSGANRAAQAGRSDSEHGIDLGTALMHMEEYEQAVTQFDRGIKDIRDPSRLLNAWNNRGICLLRLKRITEATTSFNEGLRYNANSKLAWYHKALCLKELGDLNGAQRCCRRALEIDPNYVEARELSQIL